ncbi:MAG: DUF3299 domain-containing protein [Deltaproteobacteria bacterium]|jgi:hypothetical protein|nr:DUF3299 domain-containing protein [Deltaproteobacteria bacterium]
MASAAPAESDPNFPAQWLIMSLKAYLKITLAALIVALAVTGPHWAGDDNRAARPLFPVNRAQAAEPSPKGQMVDGYYQNNWLIWEELTPPEWQPEKIIEDLKLNEMTDNDPRVEAALEEFLKRWNAAPVNQKLNGRPVKIPGFVVPLDFEKTEIDEFLLVPYFGACIHVPPPPPNQIVYVKTAKPAPGLSAMEVVWVYGQISVERFNSELGSAGYTIGADKVEIYQEGS